jgi:MacB-like periplasmic core domain/FtsX-like permease family
MTAVLARLRAELRTRWLAWLAVALIVGFGGGVVIGLVAGARRTENAYPAFVRSQHAADVLVAGKSDFGLIGSVDLDQVQALPQVGRTARATVSLLFAGMTGDGRRVGPVDVFPVAPDSERIGRDIERWHMESGRPADPVRIDEATASFELADRLHLKVGDTMRLHFVKSSSFVPVAATLLSQFGPRLEGVPGSEASSIDRLADGPDVTFRIVGIEASPAEFPPLAPDLAPALHLTPAFSRAHAHELVASPVMYVRLKPGADLTEFTKAVEQLAPGQPVAFVVSRAFQTPKVQRSIDVEATALRLLAGLTLLALLLVVGQALVRQAFLEARDDRVLRALGFTRSQLAGLVIARGLAIAVVGAVVAVVVALLGSPLMPIGLARTAELEPGLSFDGAVVGLGAIAILALMAVLSVWAALRLGIAERRGHEVTRRPIVDRVASGASLPPTAGVGVRFALDPGRGRTAVPVWTAVIGAALALGLLSGTWAFRDSLDRLLATPHLYGWNWSVKTGAPALPDIAGTLVPAFEADAAVGAVASGTVTQLKVGDQRTDVLAVDQTRGKVAPTVLEGRLPEQNDEVMLGSKTLEDLDLGVGDSTFVRIGDTSVPVRIVGRGVFPEFGDAGRLGNGAFMTYTALGRLLPDAKANLFLVRFRAGADEAAEIRRFRAALEPVPTRDSGRPRDLEDLASVQALPAVLATILALLAAAMLAHTLLTSVRRRRRDLAILKTMGFVRRQVALAVVWQTTTLASLALLIGIPLGILAGRAAWISFADGLGAVPDPAIPVLQIALTIPLTILFANAIAAVPAMVAGRTKAAVALHSE